MAMRLCFFKTHSSGDRTPIRGSASLSVSEAPLSCFVIRNRLFLSVSMHCFFMPYMVAWLTWCYPV